MTSWRSRHVGGKPAAMTSLPWIAFDGSDRHMMVMQSEDTMTTYFVTRHKGALKWAHRQGYRAAVAVDDFNADVIEPGDRVLGTLPVHIIAEICERGGRFLHLQFDETPRGAEWSADEMERNGARLVEYRAEQVDDTGTAVGDASKGNGTR